MPLIIMLSIFGVVLYFRRIGRLTDSLAILNSVSALVVILYIGSLVGFLRQIALGLALIGILLLIFEFKRIHRLEKFSFSTPIFIFMLIPVFYWIIHSESRPMLWDEYSHWGVYVREMVTTHQLWTIQTNSTHPDYPPANSLWQYFFTVITGYDEGTVYLAHFVFLITPLLVFFENISRKKLIWIPVVLSMLALGLSNFGHGIVSLYVDHILGVWYAGIILQGLRSDPDRPYVIGMLSMPLAVLILIKDAGILLVVSAIGFLFFLSLYRRIRTKGMILPNRNLTIVILFLVGLPLLALSSWQLNRNSVGVIAKGEGTGLIKILLKEKSRLSHQELQKYKANFLDVILDQQLSKDKILHENYNEYGYRLKQLFTDKFRVTPLVFLIIFALLSIFLITKQSSTLRIEIIILFLILFGTLILYVGIIYLTYPLLYSPNHALNLKSFLRYLHTIILPLFFVGMGLFTPAFKSYLCMGRFWFKFPSSTFIFGVFILLIFIFETPYLKRFYTPSTFKNYPENYALRWRQDTDILTENLRNKTKTQRLWVFLPFQDNVSTSFYNHRFMETVIRYQMTPTLTFVERSPNFLERPKGEIVNIWKNYNFLWFPVKNSRNTVQFEKKFSIPMSMHRVSRVEKYKDQIKLLSAVR